MTDVTPSAHKSEAPDFAVAHDVFISYAREDEANADSLEARLKEASLNVFLDRRSLLVGVDWHAELMTAISGAATLVVIVSEAWLRSSMCQEELALARDQGKSVIAYLPAENEASPSNRDARLAELPVASSMADVARLVREALPFGRLQARLELAADMGTSSSEFAGTRGRRDLRAILNALQSAGIAPSAAVSRFRAEVDRAHRQRVSNRVVACCVAMTLAAGAIALDRTAGFSHDREVQEGQMRQSLSLAGQSLESTSYDAFRLALRAVREYPTESAITAARQALAGVPSTRDIATMDAGAAVMGAGIRDDGVVLVLASNGTVVRSDATGSSGSLDTSITDARVGLDGGAALIRDRDGVLTEWSLDTLAPTREIARHASAIAASADLGAVAWSTGQHVTIAGSWSADFSVQKEVIALAIGDNENSAAVVDEAGSVYVCAGACEVPQRIGAIPTEPRPQVAMSPSCYGWDDVPTGRTQCIWWRSGDESGSLRRPESAQRGWAPANENRFVAARGSGLLDMTSSWLDLAVANSLRTRFEQVDGGHAEQGPFEDGTVRTMPDGSAVAVAWRSGGAVLSTRVRPQAVEGHPIGEYSGTYLAENVTRVDDAWSASFSTFDLTGQRNPRRVPLDLSPDEISEAGWDTSKWHASAVGETVVLSLTERSIVWVQGRRVAELPAIGALALDADGSTIAAVLDGSLWLWTVDKGGLHKSDHPIWLARDGTVAGYVAWLGDDGLVFTTSDRMVHLFRNGTEAVETALAATPIGLAASRSGKFIVVSSGRWIYVLDDALEKVATAESQNGWGFTPRIAPDDSSVVFTDSADAYHYQWIPTWKALSLPTLRPMGTDLSISEAVAFVPLPAGSVLGPGGERASLCLVCGYGTPDEVISSIESAARILGVGEFPQGTIREVSPSPATSATTDVIPLSDSGVRTYLQRFVRAVRDGEPESVQGFVEPTVLSSLELGRQLNIDPAECSVEPSGYGACGGSDPIPDMRCAVVYEVRYVRTPNAIYIYEYAELGDTC